MGIGEVLLLGLVTWALVAFCLTDIARHSRERMTWWVVLLALGVVIWPLAWVTGAAYIATRKDARQAT